MRSAKRSSTSVAALVAATTAAALVTLAGLATGSDALAQVGLGAAVVAAGALGISLIVNERSRHEVVEDENARLLADAQEREAERARLSDQLITAEQEERRRLALFLHDGPVQSLSGIALMLDAVADAIDGNRLEEARRVLASCLDRQRETIRSLRDLSFNLEPVVLRDQGFGPALRALAEQLGMNAQLQITLEVDAADSLGERAQVALYQIIREALHQAIRRGPSKIDVHMTRMDGDALETVISDNGAGERRRRIFEALEERARTLNGELSVETGEDGGTAVRIVLPAYSAQS